MASTTTAPAASVHPLDPLSASEVGRAWEILRVGQSPGPKSRVIFIMLHEPGKKVVLGHRPGDAVERAAFVVLVDGAAGKTFEDPYHIEYRGPHATITAAIKAEAPELLIA